MYINTKFPIGFKVITYRSKAGVLTNIATLLEKIVQRKIFNK